VCDLKLCWCTYLQALGLKLCQCACRQTLTSSFVHSPALNTQPQTLLMQLFSNVTSSFGPPPLNKLWKHSDKLRRLDDNDYAFLPLQTLKHVLFSRSNIGNACVKKNTR
jgi:hypothetical protein